MLGPSIRDRREVGPISPSCDGDSILPRGGVAPGGVATTGVLEPLDIRVGVWALAGLARLLTGAVRWVASSSTPARQRIYFANHTSHLDALVMWTALPPALRRVTRPVAARDYWDADSVRRYLARRLFRAVLIDRVRGHRQSDPIGDMLDALGAGYSLILFPEGTRGPGNAIAPFQCGLYHLARARPDVELLPVHLANLSRVLPKGSIVPTPLLTRVTYGAPLRVEPDEAPDTFLERARRAVEALADA